MGCLMGRNFSNNMLTVMLQQSVNKSSPQHCKKATAGPAGVNLTAFDRHMQSVCLGLFILRLYWVMHPSF